MHADDVLRAPVAAGQATTGSDEVVVARIAPGLQISSRVANSAGLTASSSTIASTTRSHVGEVVEAGAAGEPGEGGVALGLGRAGRAATAFSSDLAIAARTPSDLLLAAADEHDVVPGLGEHLDDAAGHRPGADHADPADVVAQPAAPSPATGVSASATTTGLSGAS